MFDDLNFSFDGEIKQRKNQEQSFQFALTEDELDFGIQSPISYPSIGPEQEDFGFSEFAQNISVYSVDKIINNMDFSSYDNQIQKMKSPKQPEINDSKEHNEAFKPFLSLESCEETVQKIRSSK